MIVMAPASLVPTMAVVTKEGVIPGPRRDARLVGANTLSRDLGGAPVEDESSNLLLGLIADENVDS